MVSVFLKKIKEHRVKNEKISPGIIKQVKEVQRISFYRDV